MSELHTREGAAGLLYSEIIKGEREEPHELAMYLMLKFHFKTFKDTEKILVYNGGSYIPWGDMVIKEEAQKLKNDIITHHVNEILNHIRRKSYVDRADFNKDPYVVNFKNGLFDIRTRELKDHSPEHYIVSQIPHNYNPKAECPKWLKFLGEVLPSEQDRAVLQEAFGYCFYPTYRYHKAFLLEGQGGNGKGVVLHTLEKMLGEENVSNKELQQLDSQRFATAGLYGKLANVAADIPSKKLRHTGVFKALTGGDRISAEFKGENSFEFRNVAKLFFSGNQVPLTGDETDAFFMRWIIFTFPNTFRGTPKEDPNLERKMEEELEGIIAWAINGLFRLLDQEGFSDSKSMEELREFYIRKSDSVACFFKDCLVEDSNSYLTKDDVYSAYVSYTKERGIIPEHKQTLGKRLPMQSGVIRAGRRRIDGRLTQVWEGVDFLSKEEKPLKLVNWCSPLDSARYEHPEIIPEKITNVHTVHTFFLPSVKYENHEGECKNICKKYCYNIGVEKKGEHPEHPVFDEEIVKEKSLSKRVQELLENHPDFKLGDIRAALDVPTAEEGREIEKTYRKLQGMKDELNALKGHEGPSNEAL